jgi:hypothetical protein
MFPLVHEIRFAARPAAVYTNECQLNGLGAAPSSPRAGRNPHDQALNEAEHTHRPGAATVQSGSPNCSPALLSILPFGVQRNSRRIPSKQRATPHAARHESPTLAERQLIAREFLR